jgi:hypothetical protein
VKTFVTAQPLVTMLCVVTPPDALRPTTLERRDCIATQSVATRVRRLSRYKPCYDAGRCQPPKRCSKYAATANATSSRQGRATT